MFYYKILRFYKDFKIGNLCFLKLHSVRKARILYLSLEIMLSPPKVGMKDLHNSKGFSFIVEQV